MRIVLATMSNRGSELLRALNDAGVSQAAIAAAAGVSQPSVSRWLKGATPKTIATRRKVEKFTRECRMRIPIEAWDEPVETARTGTDG